MLQGHAGVRSQAAWERGSPARWGGLAAAGPGSAAEHEEEAEHEEGAARKEEKREEREEEGERAHAKRGDKPQRTACLLHFPECEALPGFEDGNTMRKIGIIAANGSRARFITAQIGDDLSFEGSPKLIEHEEVINPLGARPAREKFSDRESRKPSGAGPKGALPVTDDHREAHEAEDERRFVRMLIEAADRFIQAERPSRLLLLAEPQLLGVLRGELNTQRWGSLQVLDLAQDLSGQSLQDMREVLSRRGLLPKPELPVGGVFRPRGQAPSTR